jgi:hypothetical protein
VRPLACHRKSYLPFRLLVRYRDIRVEVEQKLELCAYAGLANGAVPGVEADRLTPRHQTRLFDRLPASVFSDNEWLRGVYKGLRSHAEFSQPCTFQIRVTKQSEVASAAVVTIIGGQHIWVRKIPIRYA